MSAAVFEYQPVGLDLFSKSRWAPPAGTKVVKTHPGHGAPRNGVMGHCYIADAKTGEFYGLVLMNSLRVVKS